ncbi:D-alanyl-D-alanine carboxypeptidase (penicillin-binding protein 5/6) [Caldalkalibacillus uzonensis]|uniref:D-alanyl-D-alanine carboxypeptidase (Penicillin-binding protein 5/6) n=1 Tax=Caldalkalibacillus uzonensis TaxID=353224 RepID=A0ABU0CWD3_9BACI|nr:D-alanyl-D-alanine carboxypeptidase family protein [Caldalkalibacillus uzonensis]MDQ0340716.1 D-alanyl-D-alanine carboxypeptidase (penicillin-binding protein 5/6) [Caldalkalibacillus uzonensis]
MTDRSVSQYDIVRLLIIGLIISGLLFYPAVPQAQELDHHPFTAEGIVLMDAKTGQVLYSKNAEQPFYPASITKIMTAILALESGRLDEMVVTSELARHAIGNRIYLAEGEEKPLIDLVYGIMLNSGNDAAIAIAEHLGGSVEGFAEMMNAKAKEIGALETHFVNPHGLHDDDHYTTAMDMAKIAQYALQNPLFREIVTTKTMPWFGEEWHSNLVNTNRLLWDYEGTTGIKTGYTSAAGQTFVASAERDGTELIVVLLKATHRQNLWQEAAALLDYGFEHYQTVKVWNEGDYVTETLYGQEHVFQLAEDVYVTMPKAADGKFQWDERLELTHVTPPFIKNMLAGHLVVETEDHTIMKVPVHYMHSRELSSDTEMAVDSKASVSTQSIATEDNVLVAVEDLVAHGTGEHIVSVVARWWYIPFLALLVLFVYQRRRRKKTAMRGLSSQTHSKHWPPTP